MIQQQKPHVYQLLGSHALPVVAVAVVAAGLFQNDSETPSPETWESNVVVDAMSLCLALHHLPLIVMSKMKIDPNCLLLQFFLHNNKVKIHMSALRMNPQHQYSRPKKNKSKCKNYERGIDM